jgi:type I restriction enzyme M protein
MNTSSIVQKLWNYCNVLRDDSLADTDNLPPPGVIAAEIVEDLEAALEQMRLIAEDLADVAAETS